MLIYIFKRTVIPFEDCHVSRPDEVSANETMKKKMYNMLLRQ